MSARPGEVTSGDDWFQGGREVSHGPAGAYLSRAASPDLKRNARMEPVEDDFGRGNVAFARDGFAERAQNGQRVGVRSPVGTPNDWGVGDVLAKESSQVRAVTLQLGRHPGLRAVSASLQSVRRTDGHVERRVGVAQGRGENIRRSQIGAWDEAGNIHLGGVVTLLRSRVQEGGDSVVTTSGLAQGAAGGVRCSRVQDARVAGGTGDGLSRPGAAQTEADRVDILIGLQGRAVAWVEPPEPRVVHVRVAELGETSARSPGALTLVHLQQTLTNTRVNVRSDDALNLGAFARVRVLFVAVAVVWRDAPGVARGGGRQVTHGRLGAREHVLPEEVALSKSLIKLAWKLKSCSGGESVNKARQGFIGASVVLRHDRLSRGSDGCAEMIHHGDHERARKNATRHEGRQSDSHGRAQPKATSHHASGSLPPRVIREIATQ